MKPTLPVGRTLATLRIGLASVGPQRLLLGQISGIGIWDSGAILGAEVVTFYGQEEDADLCQSQCACAESG